MRARLARLLGSTERRRIISNFSWLVSQRGLTLAVSLPVSVWLARYLGPEGFGTLNYAISFVALFGTFTYLGISGVLVRELVESPEARDELLGTAFVLKLVGGLVAAAIIAGVLWARGGSPPEQALILILAGGMVFRSVTVIAFYYQSRVESRFVVVASSAALLVSASVNGVLILQGAPLVAFAAAVVAQELTNMVGLFVAYRSQGLRVADWRFRLKRATSLLGQSWPLVISSFGAVVYLRVDQVMIEHLASSSEVGVYAVAAKFSEVWYFLPGALAASLFPKIIRLKRSDSAVYRAQMQRMYRVMVLAALAVAIPVTLAAEPVLSTLYGAEYDGAAFILRIHIWACPAVFMGTVLSKWLISEDLLVFSMTRHGLGALVNVGLNVLLIPRYGGAGAAVGDGDVLHVRDVPLLLHEPAHDGDGYVDDVGASGALERPPRGQ